MAVKAKIVNSKDLTKECWLPNRHFGECHKCNRVAICKLPEAKKGRITLAKERIQKAESILEAAKARLEEVSK